MATTIKAGKAVTTRPVEWADVRKIATWLNAAGVNYAIIGGWAMRVFGSPRTSDDLDILISYQDAELTKLQAALANLPGAKIAAVSLETLGANPVLRIRDDLQIDIVFNVGNLTYCDMEIQPIKFADGLVINFASGSSMYHLKQATDPRTVKHIEDFEFLRSLGYQPEYTGQLIDPDSPSTPKDPIIRSEADSVVDEDDL